MRHRFLRLPSQLQVHQQVDIAEADESYFLDSSKDKFNLLRQARRRGGEPGLLKEQVTVLIVRDRARAMTNLVLLA